ncbi:MAG TPA: methyltransferase domain-containing protein [Gammaproteobacteria bacterium]|nr:methyltransferase domain-containing protein [Gammaproteobacteria bacterium]HPQ23440.1 methyltransferase domain-containing protein [Gammaproteobacteria bacterium]
MSASPRLNPQFLSAWLRNPLQMGAVAASSDELANAMAAQVNADSDLVIELGAGTGAVTSALLARGVAPSALVVVEKDPELARQLAKRFRSPLVITGDATRLQDLLSRSHDRPADAVVSSLPLLGMRTLTRVRVLAQAFAALRPDGRFVQFTYSPKPPIPGPLVAALGVRGERVGRVLWNLPPASVWVYKKID